jgi:hypothetical protein
VIPRRWPAQESALVAQENVELSRAFLDELARAGQQGLDPEATVSKMAEFWDPAE